MQNSLFHVASLDVLAPQRAKELEAFALKAISHFAYRGSKNVTHFVDLDPDDFDQLNASKTLGPILDTRGSLDYVALAMQEGIEIEDHWDYLHNHELASLIDDLNFHGLHGLHFRMGITDPQLRITLTQQLADILASQSIYHIALLVTSIDRQPHYPVNSLSYTSDEAADCIEHEYKKWLKEAGSTLEKHPYDPDHLQALRNIGASALSSSSDSQAAIRHLLSEKGSFTWNDLSKHQQATQIEKALLPLVYNRGYRLKAEGLDCEAIADELNPVVQHLLQQVSMSGTLLNALHRQVLVNLFSAFPEGLELLQVKASELQGLPYNPAVLNDPDAKLFHHTFSGPLMLFRAQRSAPQIHGATQVADFLAQHGYPIHPDLAVGGLLATPSLHEDLILNCQDYSHVIEQRLLAAKEATRNEGETASVAELPLIGYVHLAKPEMLRLYGDEAALQIIERSLPLARGKLTPSIKSFFADRPHLVEPTLDIMQRNYYINEKTFEFCGFGLSELKMLGAHAPQRMLTDRLEDDLGL